MSSFGVWSLDPTFRPKRLLVAELKLEAKFPEKDREPETNCFGFGCLPTESRTQKSFPEGMTQINGMKVIKSHRQAWRVFEDVFPWVFVVAAAPVYRFII